MKKNLDHNALPSVEEIRLYHEGKLSPHRAHEIELIAEENPMLGDALEGFNSFPVFDAVPGISAAVSQQAASGVAASGKVAAVVSNTGSAWWHLNGWILGLGIGISAAVVTVSLTDDSDKSVTQKVTVEQSIASNIETEQPEEIIPHTSESPENETVAEPAQAGTTPSVLQIGDANSSQTSSAQYERIVRNTPEAIHEFIPTRSVEPINPQNLPSNIETDKNLKVENTTLVAVAMVTIQNHRVADYSELRTRTFEPIKLEELGLPTKYADYEVKQQIRMENDGEVGIPYLLYVEQCLLAFKNEEYKTAIKGFNRILSQYEDDINAQFYGAMSYYRNDQPVLALQLFEKAEKNTITSFREEIMFYKAKCLKMLNRTEESTPLFEEVIRKNGFYRQQAEKELQD
jgi:TolA-binding protein